jgi:hypothetical protein
LEPGVILFLGSAHKTISQYAGDPHIGRLCVPDDFHRVSETAELMPWAADNGAFSAFRPEKFWPMLDYLQGVPGCRFVACPDVVGDWQGTAWKWTVHSPGIIRRGLPIALVAQDGLTPARVPWWQLDALFIGGTTLWKMSPEARRLVQEAKDRGLWVHFGRVNSFRRMTYARSIGCDSVDGSSFSKWRDTYVPKALAWLASSGTQLSLEVA